MDGTPPPTSLRPDPVPTRYLPKGVPALTALSAALWWLCSVASSSWTNRLIAAKDHASVQVRAPWLSMRAACAAPNRTTSARNPRGRTSVQRRVPLSDGCAPLASRVAGLQINVGLVDKSTGLYTQEFKTFALCGYIRSKVRHHCPSALRRTRSSFLAGTRKEAAGEGGFSCCGGGPADDERAKL